MDKLNLPYQMRKARQQAGLTQVQLGKKIGANYVQVSWFENGRRPLSIRWLQKIAIATNTELVVALVPQKQQPQPTRPQPQPIQPPRPLNPQKTVPDWYK